LFVWVEAVFVAKTFFETKMLICYFTKKLSADFIASMSISS
jgi:hypothetical protein